MKIIKTRKDLELELKQISVEIMAVGEDYTTDNIEGYTISYGGSYNRKLEIKHIETDTIMFVNNHSVEYKSKDIGLFNMRKSIKLFIDTYRKESRSFFISKIEKLKKDNVKLEENNKGLTKELESLKSED